MIIELPNYVDAGTIRKIRDTAAKYTEVESEAKYGSYRDGKTLFITGLTEKYEELAELDAILHKIFSDVQDSVLSRRYKPSFPSADSGYEYHVYRPGDICHPHGDGEITKGELLRYASVTLHLNTIESGGELVFPAQNKSVKTEAGKIVIFPPYNMFEHYSTPAAVPREVVVTWFVYNNIRIREI